VPQFIQRQLSQFPTGVLPVGTKKCWLILHANIFLQTTKGIKLKTAQKPLHPTPCKLLSLSAIQSPWEHKSKTERRVFYSSVM